MSSHGSVTRCLGRLQAGDSAAAQQLWQRYFARLVELARRKLRDSPRRAADEEDVVLSAFDSFFRGMEQGRFPRLCDRDGLWGLLATLIARKAAHQLRDERRLKRGGAAVVRTSSADGDEEALLSREPSPQLAAEVAEEYRRLLRSLDDRVLEAVALARMDGYSVEEIAQQLHCSPRSIKRKLELIRGIWEKELGP